MSFTGAFAAEWKSIVLATAAAGWSAPWSTRCTRAMPDKLEVSGQKGCAVIPLQNVAADGGLELGQQVKARCRSPVRCCPRRPRLSRTCLS